jgi:GT2 family glycosyltransferase
VLPTAENVKKTVDLLEKGYAFVALYRFAFFGFKKELMRRIGMMDENYIGGGYEDDDFYIRLIERNLSMYVTHEVNYTPGNSCWNYEKAREYHYRKWNYSYDESKLQRCLSEPRLNYNLGESIATQFLPGNVHSYVIPDQVSQFFKINIRS